MKVFTCTDEGKHRHNDWRCPSRASAWPNMPLDSQNCSAGLVRELACWLFPIWILHPEGSCKDWLLQDIWLLCAPTRQLHTWIDERDFDVMLAEGLDAVHAPPAATRSRYKVRARSQKRCGAALRKVRAEGRAQCRLTHATRISLCCTPPTWGPARRPCLILC